MAAAAVPASLLLDRFVSASSAEDAQTSLERILEALQSNSTSSKTAGGGQDESTGKMTPEDIWSDPEVLTAFRYVLRTGNHKHHNAEVPVEEGASMVCKIFLEMIEQDPKSPLLEKDESLVESLIDVVSNDGAEGEEAISTPMYTRVLALQLLTKLCAKRPSKAQAQLLQAPNGLHRLGDLLQVNQEEIIRNEALLLAPVIAEWPSCAKIWMFSGVADQVMLLAVEEGGLTGGNLLVQDCLDLLFNLWKHDPNNLADLVFQSPTLTNNLPRLLDLRQGTEFLNPPKKKETVKKDDDLDDILKSASSKESESKKDETVIPRLTEAEEKIVFRMLDILALLLESENLKKSVWSQQMGLCSLIWELALVSPPPPQVPFVCAVPSASLQQKALERIALYFNDPASMERHAGLDRLLYLVCTGGLGSNLKERMGISQAALHVIRKTISKDTASEMLMNTLAPPISMDEDGEDRNQSPPPTVVHKLLNTVAENLFVTEGIDPERRKIFLAGALGGLSIFFMDQTSREVMLRITTRSSIPDAGDEEEEETPDGPSSTTNTSLVETILLAISTLEEAQNPADAFLSMTLLRFLCHWTIDTPLVVQAILSSNQSSILLSALVGIKTKNESHKKGVAVLGKLLMGLCMEYMGEDEGRCGGWTRASIMELITKKSGGVSKYTRSLEQFKSVRDFGGTMPWSVCELEFKFWSQWYSDCVLLVRKRVVQELTGSGGEEDEGSSEKDSSTNGSARSLQKLVFQQSQEIDELQQSLRKANEKIETQQSELSTYKRRVESAPSQLDNMLTEFSAKTSELESKVKELEAEKTAIEEKHKSELKDREDRIASLQKELEESQAREKESRDETETLREEIDSLSQAYTSLEQEYRRQQTQISSGAPSEQQAGDQGQEGPQDQPNTQHGGGSTAISALRAENERLRSDAQAADQWMTMAVEKMKGLDEQNATLQTELANLRASQSNSTTEQQQQLQQQYHALFEENQQRVQQQHQLQAQLENAVKDTKQLQQVLDQERAKYVELQQHQLQTQEELQNALATMEENKTEVSTSEAEFQRKIAALEGDLEDATAEIFRLRDEMASQQQGQVVSKEQESVLASKNAELGELRQMLEEQSSRLDAENGALQKEIEVARSELDKTQRREQEEIYKKEARIRELEARISGGSGGGYTEEDIKSRDEEISELRAANEAAQEWMSKAVEHHRNLSQRHAAVTAENACLSSQIRDLQTKVADNETYVSRAYVLEQETSMQARQLREAQLSLAASEEEVKRLKEELSQAHSQANSLVSTSDELQRLREEVSCMETSLQEQVATCEQLRSELNAQTESKDAALEELETMKNDNEQLAAEAERLRKEIQILRSEEQLGSTEDKQQFSELNSQLQKLEKTNAQLKRSQKEDKMTMDQLKAEVDSLRSAKETMVSGSLAHEVTTSAEDVFGTVSIGGQSGVAADPSSSTSSAQQVFSSGPPADLSAPSQGAQMHGVSTSTTYHNAQQVTAHELFGSGSTPAMGPSSSAPGAQDIFGSRPSVGRSSGALSAHDVFGSRPATISAHDVFGAGPGALAPQAATAHDVFGSGEASGALDQTSISTAPGGSESQPAISTGEDVSRELETELAEKNHAVQELESKLKTLSAELNEAKKKIAEDETAVSAWEEQVTVLESSIKDLEKRLSEQEEEANNVISQWRSTCNELEAKNTELTHTLKHTREQPASNSSEGQQEPFAALQAELDETKTELATAKTQLTESEGVVLKWEEKVAELESTIKSMEEQLTEQEEEASTAISKWQESCTALEERNVELLKALGEAGAGAKDAESVVVKEARPQESFSTSPKEMVETKTALSESQAKLEEAESVIVKWEERVAELELRVKDMEAQLSEQEVEANTAITKWQESCAALEEKNTELMKSLEASGEDDQEVSHESIASLEAKLKETETALAEARESLTDDGDVVLMWQERVAELENTVKVYERQMNEQEEEANTVIEKWQETCTDLEAKNSELLQLLNATEASTTSVDSAKMSPLQEELNDIKAQLEEAKKIGSEDKRALLEWESKNNEMSVRASDLEQKLRAQEDEANNIIAKWEESYSALEARKAELEESLNADANNQQTAIQDLEKKLKTQKEEADCTIAQWKESYNTLAAKNTELEQSLEAAAKYEKEVRALEEKLNTHEEEAKAAILKWQESYTALEAEKKQLEESLENVSSNQEAAVKDMEEKLQTQIEEANNTIAQWQESYNALVTKNNELNESILSVTTQNDSEISELQQRLASQEQEADAAVAKWEESYRALDELKIELEQRLDSQEQEANAAVAKWEESCHTLEKLKSQLEEGFEADKREKESRIASLEAQLQEAKQELEEQLADKEKEREDAISQWQERNAALEMEISDLNAALEAALNKSKELTDENASLTSLRAQLTKAETALAEAQKAAEMDDAVREREERITDLEAKVNALKEERQEQNDANSRQAAALQESSQSLDAKNTELSEKLEKANNKIELLENAAEDLKREKQANEEQISYLKSNLEESEASLTEAKQNLSGAANSLHDSEEKVAQLEESIKELEERIKAKDTDLAASISEWQEHCNLLERQATKMSEALENAKKEKYDDRDATDHEKELEERIEELERELSETEHEAADAVASWQESYAALEAKNNELAVELESLNEELESLKEMKHSLAEELNQYKDLEAEARNEVSNLNSRLESLGDEINKEWEAKVEQLNAKVASLETGSKQIGDASPVSEATNAFTTEDLGALLTLKEQELADVSAELEKVTKERDDAIAEHRQSGGAGTEEKAPSATIVSSWTDDLDDIDIDETKETGIQGDGKIVGDTKELKAKVEALELEVDKVTKERDTTSKALNEAQETVETWAERMEVLEEKVKDLEEQLESETAEATEAIASWDARCTELTDSLNERNVQLESRSAELLGVLQDELDFKNKLMSAHEENYTPSSFTDDIEESRFNRLREELNNLNASFEQTFNSWGEEIKTLREELENSQSNQEAATVAATENAEVQRANEESLRDRICGLEQQLTEREGSVSKEESATERISELEEQLIEFELLQANEESMKGKIADLERKISEYESTISQLETCLTSEREMLEDLKAKNSDQQACLEKEKTEKSDLETVVEKLQQRVSEFLSLEADFESSLEKARTESSGHTDLLKEKSTLESEVANLKDVVYELEDELQKANDALQVYITQEVSDKATEVASQALREQLDEIRRQASADRAAFESEKEARIAAQREIDLLRTDLHTLVDINEQEKALYGPDALTLKAGEKIHKKERSEITELRKSLSRAVDELREAKASERDAEERASKASLHISVCEEELSSAKSDLHYLIQTMDEMREAEAARRASLENRISSLENELDIMRRFHSAEKDKVRGELNVVSMEKERIFQSLKDSEKTNAGLVFAASREYPTNTDLSPEAELIKLRIEKAQLLIAASEEGIRTERRLREVVATELSSAEADILVERERRLAAEAAVKNMQLLVTELQSDARGRQEDILGGSSSVKQGIEQENDRLKIEIDEITDENASLRLKLDAADSAQESMNYKVEKLKEECRMAQAKLHRLEREARFNTEVQAEMTRLRVSPKKQTQNGGQVTVHEDPAKDKPDDVADLYEKVQQQSEAIRKEREMYHALEEEHEELLMLLAEQEEMKRCLVASLESLGGRNAVDSATQQAKEFVRSQYGDAQ